MKRTFAVIVLGVSLLAASVAGALTPLPAPGTTSHIASLVAASSKIKTLPKKLVPPLASVSTDQTNTYFPGALGTDRAGCITLTVPSCVFGDVSSKKSVVLFGDSHAWMWLPAINYVGKKDKFKVYLLAYTACPAAEVNLWIVDGGRYNTACNTWRLQSIAAINKMKPALVLLGERTAETQSAPAVWFTDAMWQTGLEKTIVALKTSSTKVALIGDIHAFPVDPASCLASYPTDLKSCLQPFAPPSAQYAGHQAAEAAAAKAEKITLLNPLPWLCSKTSCSFVIGNDVAYWDSTHVSATYAAYLSDEFLAPLKPLI